MKTSTSYGLPLLVRGIVNSVTSGPTGARIVSSRIQGGFYMQLIYPTLWKTLWEPGLSWPDRLVRLCFVVIWQISSYGPIATACLNAFLSCLNPFTGRIRLKANSQVLLITTPLNLFQYTGRLVTLIFVARS